MSTSNTFHGSISGMSTAFIRAIPRLAARDVNRAVEFYESQLGFSASLHLEDPPDWTKALGTDADRVAGVYEAPGWALVELRSADDVRAVVPDRQGILERGGFAVVRPLA